jgi:uncharacterized protein
MTMHRSGIDRRDFLAASLTGTAALLLNPDRAAPAWDLHASAMADRALGSTGYHVRLFSLGGQATLEQPDREETAAAIVNRAIDLGVTYTDTAAAYGRGISERNIGRVMQTRRREVFLASKTHDRTRDGSLRLLEQSLRNLQTDHLDLWQIHNVMRLEQLDAIFGRGGAVEALREAREQKLVRFVGITGHYDPDVLLEGIRRYDFDTILMALNPADPHFLPFQERLLPEATRRRMGVIGMKIPARGRIFREGGITRIREPLTYVLSQPVSTVIIGCDTVAQLEENVAIATSFRQLSPAEMARIESLTASYATDAAFFKREGAGFGTPGADDQNTD